MNSLTTSTSGKSESEVKYLIENIFTRSKLIKEFLHENSLG